MNRRRVLVLALAAGLAGHATLLRAQTSGTGLRRVGVLAPSTRAKEEVILKPFFDQMRALGWIEGQNIEYDRVYAEDQMAMLPRLAAELVARKPEVIYAPPTPAAVAAKQATQTIPIVFGAISDPVGAGLMASLAHPGGNVTGMASSIAGGFSPKWTQFLREIMPGVKRIGSLGDPTDPSTASLRQTHLPLAASLGLTFIDADASSPADFDAAVEKLAAARVEAIFITGTGALAFSLRAHLIELGIQRRIPLVATNAQFAEAGALFTFGASLPDQLRRSAFPVDKILKGAKPADIPVEQPTLFELVINLRTAKALGITIPQSILLRADRVIE